jgi:aldose 1-epimerase
MSIHAITRSGVRYAARRVEEGRALVLADAGRDAVARILPHRGFNCTSFRTAPRPGQRARTLIRPPQDESALDGDPFAGGAPVLFPFPNRVRDGRYWFAGTEHRLQAILERGWDVEAGHAFATAVADRPWRVDEIGASVEGAWAHGSIALADDPETYAQYPFQVLLRLGYRLAEGELHARFEVLNEGDVAAPMGVGIHPWLALDLSEDRAIPHARSRARLRVPAQGRWELDRWMPTGEVQPVQGTRYDLRAPSALGDRFFDDVWTDLRRDGAGCSEAVIVDPEAGLEAYVRADAAFREWCVYAPVDDAVVCLEPYTCVTDAINLLRAGHHDTGLIVLAPGERWSGHVTFGLRPQDTLPRSTGTASA